MLNKTEINKDSVFINGTEYLPKSKETKLANNTEGLPYVIIRTYSAGIHIGYLKSKEYTPAGIVVQLVNTRRVYSWAGAMTLSQLALEGSQKPEKCQITVEIPENEMVAIEIIPVSDFSFQSLNSIKPWKV